MTADSENTPERAANSKSRFYVIVALCFVLVFLAVVAFGLYDRFFSKPSKNSPPDLSRCTHLDIEYAKPVMDYYLPKDRDPNFLSAAEADSLWSIRKYTIEDANTIKKLALALKSGSFNTEGIGYINVIMNKHKVSVFGFRDDECIVRITLYTPSFIVVDNTYQFLYDKFLPDLFMLASRQIKPPEIRPAIFRVLCRINIQGIGKELISFAQSSGALPSPSQWCDIFVQNSVKEDKVDEEYVREFLRCPGAGEGKCHYAMNPNCNPDSPGDMVLLFETKDGWNQYGGPDLFTFDNHEPKGGCILLNNGTVKFIRTEEELHNLRWE